ncbi:phage holin family protein [Lederbergia sp. NSJ-179]|uniref:phage holin family protein n=1 Tax=Lederbergia sp. NSJ-179 TaxID=2931402 RepID=UPI001FD1505B|nr:phage holin family protein [Lederbergia sp. NSJ-179]MCJ7840210.1 phage holin family protein [Lederbergia sp. NSJ-179]
MKWGMGILVNALLFLAFAGYFEGVEVTSIWAAIGASVILSILNMLVRPLLILFTLPVTILTLGLFLFVINACTLLMTDALMGSLFEISGFGLALLLAVIMAVINLIIQKTIIEPRKQR